MRRDPIPTSRVNGAVRTLSRATTIFGVCAVVVAVLAPASVGVALASQAAAGAGEGQLAVALSPQRLNRPTYDGTTEALNPTNPAVMQQESVRHASTGMWVWNQGRMALQLVERSAGSGGFRTLVATDVDTNQEIGRLKLPRHVYGTADSLAQQEAPTYVGAVDEAGGRLFLSYRHPKIHFAATEASGTNAEGASHGQVCTLDPNFTVNHPCVAGVLVVDLAALAVTGDIPLEALRVDGALPARVLTTQYAPPRGPDDAGKVLLLVQDLVIPAPYGVMKVLPSLASLKKTGLYVHYVVQLDPQTMRQDWAVRVDACRSNRENTDTNTASIEGYLPYGAAVLRGASLSDPSIAAACHYGSSAGVALVKIPLNAAGNPATLPVEVADPSGGLYGSVGSGEAPAVPVAVASAQLATYGPNNAMQVIADQTGERMLLEVTDGDPLARVWWVFDTARWIFLGTIGIGPTNENSTTRAESSIKGFDPVHGRLYHLMPDEGSWKGGLFVADVRRDPLPQAVLFPEFSSLAVSGGQFTLPTFSGTGSEPIRVYVTQYGDPKSATHYRVLVDSLPTSGAPEVNDGSFAGRTLDLDEAEGVTSSAFDGAARGYGARVLLVGGLESVPRAGPVDPLGQSYQCLEGSGNVCVWMHSGHAEAFEEFYPQPSPCGRVDRDVTLGFVGPSQANVVDAAGARGGATPVAVDSSTRADSEAPASRCSGTDWDQTWEAALFGKAPVAEPTVPWVFEEGVAECIAADEPTGSTGDAVASRFAAQVDCAGEESSGYAYARGMEVGGVNIGESLSSYRIYRDPERGIVSRVESVARGVSIPGVLRIDTVRGVAESWANGRRYASPEPGDGEGYDPNCDLERTAGTCFSRHVFGFWTPGYSCGPCGDEQGGLERMSRAFGAYGSIRLRNPDPVLARGADNGFAAAITKTDSERFGDLVLNNDLLQTVLPTLEIIRQAPPTRSLASGGPRGRQIIQLAGVEVGTSYGISCVLVYDETANTCAAPAQEPGSIQVSLSDPAGEPLAGGAFELREDIDGDGVLGLVDTLIPDGACVTAEDGIGTCVFENLQPGSYLVSQVAAPPGYAKSTEPWVSEVASGEQRVVAFTNVSNVSTIDMTVTDENGAPLSGATFAAYPDPDADGKVAPDAEPAATCTTDAAGVCSMQVPAGSYVLVQTGAPGGLEGIEPVAFTFASGGQVAAVTVVNYPPDVPQAPEGAASPIDYTPPVDHSPPVETIGGYAPPAIADQPDLAPPPQVSVPERVGGTITQVIRAPGDALRLLARDPKQAVAWTAALALLCLAAMAIRRRQLLGGLTAVPLVAFAGPSGSPPPPPRLPAGPPSGPETSGPGSSGPRGGTTAAFREPAGTAGRHGGAALASATAVLERPSVAGAAPAIGEHVQARVVAAIGSQTLATIVRGKLDASDYCRLDAVVASVEDLRQAIAEHSPDVVVVDLTFPTGDAHDILAALEPVHPAGRTLVLIPSVEVHRALVVRGYLAGVGGLLLATEDLGNGQLDYAIRCLASGRPFYGPSVQAVLLEHWADYASAERGRHSLSDREAEVAKLAAAGMSRMEIAARLHLSPLTVKRHLYRIREKLGITDPASATQLRLGLSAMGLLDTVEVEPGDD